MKIKVPFIVATKDLKSSESVLLDVTFNIGDDKIVNGDIEYSVHIPDHMFDELKDTEPFYLTNPDINNERHVVGCFSERTITRKFKKLQTSTRINVLKDFIMGLTIKINELHSIETATMKKKIFIKYQHENAHTTNSLNGAYTGVRVNHSFRYFIGYEVMTNKFRPIIFDDKKEPIKKYITKIFYASPMSSLRHRDTGFKEDPDLFLPLPSLNQSNESFEKEYSIIDWTQEREDYCKKIQETFTKIGEELDMFLSNIDVEKFDALMESNTFKMLN